VILTFNKGLSGAAPRGIPFVWPSNPASPTASELTPGQIVDLNTNPDTSVTDSLGQLRLNYLRGDASNEGLATTNFRRRPLTKLGDIINSNPNFVGPPTAGFPDPSYVAFASANANRRPMLYIGANDGMLHGFDASLDSTRGSELLAFIPSTVFRNLTRLTSRSYNSTHRYFVDGSPIVEDAYFSGSGTWKTVLVGGLNRGGQGLYALDVTNPTNFTTGNAASLVLWEFNDADDPDLGFTFGTPVIRRMSNGRFAAIVSGGYNNSQGSAADPREVQCSAGTGTQADPYTPTGCTVSRTGNGYIFIIYLDGPTGANGTWQLGTDYFKLSTGTGSAAAPNGMASPFAADIDGTGTVDFIYSGDLNGQLWKFDVRGAPATWGLANNRVSLYQARDASNNIQPITSGVEATLHPSGNGIIVTFGTGKYLESADVSPPGPAYRTQALYGIWDLNDVNPISGQTTVTGRSQLMEQLLQPGITNFFTLTDGSIVRVTTKHRPNYGATARDDSSSYDGMGGDVQALIEARGRLSTTPANQRGWYLDLLNGSPSGAPSGERVIFAPFIRNGIVFFSSMWPINDVCLGSTAGDNITLLVATGGRPDSSVFDTNNDYTVNSNDMVTPPGAPAGVRVAVSSRRIEGGSAQPPTLIAVGSQTTSGVGSGQGLVLGAQNTTGGGPPFIQFYKFGKGPGTVTWREILY
jgi:type IV pilus assembly protein PilY1